MIFYVNDVKKTINNDDVTIVAATKYFQPDEMRQLYDEGIHDFGENRDDAFLMKHEALKDLAITWHFIGTLQTKKVKKVIDLVDCLHSLDNIKLANEINKRRCKPLRCFVQVNISDEDSKHGLAPDAVIPFLKDVASLPNIDVIGFMGMASFTDDMVQVSREFQILNDLQQQVRSELNLDLNELSIGMSNDYPVALKHHATVLRLGSVLFRKEV